MSAQPCTRRFVLLVFIVSIVAGMIQAHKKEEMVNTKTNANQEIQDPFVASLVNTITLKPEQILQAQNEHAMKGGMYSPTGKEGVHGYDHTMYNAPPNALYAPSGSYDPYSYNGYNGPNGYGPYSYNAPNGYGSYSYNTPNGYGPYSYNAPNAYDPYSYNTPGGYNPYSYDASGGYHSNPDGNYGMDDYGNPQHNMYDTPPPQDGPDNKDDDDNVPPPSDEPDDVNGGNHEENPEQGYKHNERSNVEDNERDNASQNADVVESPQENEEDPFDDLAFGFDEEFTTDLSSPEKTKEESSLNDNSSNIEAEVKDEKTEEVHENQETVEPKDETTSDKEATLREIHRSGTSMSTLSNAIVLYVILFIIYVFY